MIQSAYFVSREDGLHAVPAARSPWSENMLHGRLLAGPAARTVESDGHDPWLRVVRLTRVIRDGRRGRVADVSVKCADVEVARGSALLLRAGVHPDAEIWRAPDWDATLPEAVPSGGDTAQLVGGTSR